MVTVDEMIERAYSIDPYYEDNGQLRAGKWEYIYRAGKPYWPAKKYYSEDERTPPSDARAKVSQAKNLGFEAEAQFRYRVAGSYYIVRYRIPADIIHPPCSISDVKLVEA